MRRPRAARQDCPTEMWSSPVFFCRNGPCGQQKSPGGLAGPSGARQRRAGPLPQGIAIGRRFWEVTFWGITKECDAWPKGSAGRLPGAFGGWGSVLGLVEHGLALALHPISRCRQHHACAQHQVCQPAAGAGLDQLGILHRRKHRGLRSGGRSGGRSGSGVRSCILHHGGGRGGGGALRPPPAAARGNRGPGSRAAPRSGCSP